MVDGSLKQHSSWGDEDGWDTTRYVADFKHPETNEIHPMVTDISTIKDENGHYYPLMSTRIYPKDYDIDNLDKRSIGFEMRENPGTTHDWGVGMGEKEIEGATFFSPARPANDRHFEHDRENWGNTRLVGTPNVKGAPENIHYRPIWYDYPAQYTLHDPVNFPYYKHEGIGTAMYDMAADVIHRHTRDGHKIFPDRIRSETAKRMWAKHEKRGYWPASHERKSQG